MNLTQERVQSLFSYAPEYGNLIWKERQITDFVDSRVGNSWNSRYVGTIAGGDTGESVFIDSIKYPLKRLIWLYHKGFYPKQYIKHLNHITTDTRIENLVEANRYELGKVKRRNKANTSGFIGVYYSFRSDKWKAKININGKKVHLGSFSSIFDAAAARKQVEIKHGFVNI